MKCLVLVSGGLDSALAAALVLRAGIETVGVNLVTTFEPGGQGLDHPALVADSLGIRLFRLNIRAPFLEIIRRPAHGYGRNMNPCLDCKILMFREAWRLAEKIGASCLVTGEVVGQRPMSQQREKISLIERCSGLEGRVFRPLSAGLLPPSLPEKEGFFRRDQLLSIQGRRRRELLDSAAALGVGGFGSPGGGCLLTDRNYSRRLRDLIEHGLFRDSSINLLRFGRHLRLSADFKLTVGRDQAENRRLLGFLGRENTCLFSFGRGPVALLEGLDRPPEEMIVLAGRVVAAYSAEGRSGRESRIGVVGRDSFFRARPPGKVELEKMVI